MLIALPGGWFDEGTEVHIVADCGEIGWLVSGLRNGRPDEEVCPSDEFKAVAQR